MLHKSQVEIINIADELRGKVVWITGASTGLGAELALKLSRHGVKLILSARSVQKLDDVKKQCLGKF